MQCNGFVHLCFCDQMHLVFSHYVINMQIIKMTRSSLFSQGIGSCRESTESSGNTESICPRSCVLSHL